MKPEHVQLVSQYHCDLLFLLLAQNKGQQPLMLLPIWADTSTSPVQSKPPLVSLAGAINHVSEINTSWRNSVHIALGSMLRQVPQFLLESGYGCSDFPERAGMIGVTQPRRLAAISSAQRVAAELGCKVGSAVGYQASLISAVLSDFQLILCETYVIIGPF